VYLSKLRAASLAGSVASPAPLTEVPSPTAGGSFIFPPRSPLQPPGAARSSPRRRVAALHASAHGVPAVEDAACGIAGIDAVSGGDAAGSAAAVDAVVREVAAGRKHMRNFALVAPAAQGARVGATHIPVAPERGAAAARDAAAPPRLALRTGPQRSSEVH